MFEHLDRILKNKSCFVNKKLQKFCHGHILLITNALLLRYLCKLVMPYGVIYLGHHWFREWLNASSWSNDDLLTRQNMHPLKSNNKTSVYLFDDIVLLNCCLSVWIRNGTVKSPPWASYQIRNIAVCACAGNAGNISPPPWVSDPGMHHDTCMTHVP